jgi:hypothetical protein
VAESHERLTNQQAAGIHLDAYAAHAREAGLQQGEIGPGAEIGRSGGAELGGSGDNDIESPDYSSMRCAMWSMSKSLVLGAFAREERSQLLQLLLDDDAKPADAQGDGSNSSMGSGNGSDS